MRKLLFSFIGVVAVNSQVFAAPQPLLTKTMISGFVRAEDSYQLRCSVYADHVTIERQRGFVDNISAGTTETRNITLTTDAIKALIEKAALEPTTEDSAPCDIPTDNMVAYTNTQKALTLQSSGGCAEPKVERQGPATTVLQRLINDLCVMQP